MQQSVQSNGVYVRLPADLELLRRRGIIPEDDGYTTRLLARELARRGWRWNLEDGTASATKAYTPTGTVFKSLRQPGPEQVNNLIVVLAEAIRFDEDHGLSLAGPYHADIIARAPDGRIIAIADINNRIDLNSAVAVEFRRSLIADDQLDPRIPFLLVVSQDVGLLWDRGASGQPFVNPSTEFPTAPIMSYYLPWFDPAKRLGASEVQHTVARWLRDIAFEDTDRPTHIDKQFEGTQFLEALQGAEISMSDGE
jgi:hypothetical protein